MPSTTKRPRPEVADRGRFALQRAEEGLGESSLGDGGIPTRQAKLLHAVPPSERDLQPGLRPNGHVDLVFRSEALAPGSDIRRRAGRETGGDDSPAQHPHIYAEQRRRRLIAICKSPIVGPARVLCRGGPRSMRHPAGKSGSSRRQVLEDLRSRQHRSRKGNRGPAHPFWHRTCAVSLAPLPARVVTSLNCSAVAPAATARCMGPSSPSCVEPVSTRTSQVTS